MAKASDASEVFEMYTVSLYRPGERLPAIKRSFASMEAAERAIDLSGIKGTIKDRGQARTEYINDAGQVVAEIVRREYELHYKGSKMELPAPANNNVGDGDGNKGAA